jgi:hypothetical protein
MAPLSTTTYGQPGAETVTLPAGTLIDGAVVELHRDTDGTVTAEVRIPGSQDTPDPA